MMFKSLKEKFKKVLKNKQSVGHEEYLTMQEGADIAFERAALSLEIFVAKRVKRLKDVGVYSPQEDVSTIRLPVTIMTGIPDRKSYANKELEEHRVNCNQFMSLFEEVCDTHSATENRNSTAKNHNTWLNNVPNYKELHRICEKLDVKLSLYDPNKMFSSVSVCVKLELNGGVGYKDSVGAYCHKEKTPSNKPANSGA